MRINITTYKMNSFQKSKVITAGARAESIINSAGFFEWAFNYNFTYTDKKNIEIINIIRNCNESWNDRGNDGVAEINIQVVKRFWKTNVIGYTYGGKMQYTYSWFFNSASIESISGHIVHEYCHILGFKHPRFYTSTRQFSVPYACGNYIKGFK